MRIPVIVAFLVASTAPFAIATTSCPEHFLGGQEPVFTNQKLAAGTRELCNQGYAVMHSGLTRTPLWGAEHLTRERLGQGKGLPRSNSFRPDSRLPVKERAELKDYARSGFDRGHVCPSADAFSLASQDETYLLSNMIPQDPENNRGLHEGVESAVRNEVKRRGELYVVTGTLYSGADVQSLKGRVIVPTGIYKCVYDPRKQESGCYVEQNAPGMNYKITSVADVEALAGVSLYPGAPVNTKAKAMSLPGPKPFRSR